MPRAMRKPLLIAVVVAALFLGLLEPPAAPASAYLSEGSAAHALRANLARAYGIRHVRLSCRRLSRSKLTCGWRGRRAGATYRGRALVSRAGGSTLVQLSAVHRAA